MTTPDQTVLKTYGDRTYTHTTMVRHQGTALAFALDADRRILYSVLDLSTYDEQRGELDAAYWSENPAELAFPEEIVRVGHAVTGATAMPLVKKGGRTEAGPDDRLGPEEIDTFLSSTARLTAAAPFEVLSDGTHVVLLRQAIDAGHPDAVFVSTDAGELPVVQDTLLADRFLLVDGLLKPVSEVRYKRSRHRTEPDSAHDSLGATDMDGVPFHEPTQELGFIRHLTGGRFTAVLVPTSVQDRQRWQFFAHNGRTGRVDSFSVEQGSDGLFNTYGTRFWTSPDEYYRDAVFERQPGTCPFTDLPLVPFTPDTPLAESALRFDGGTAYVDLGATDRLKNNGGSYTLEAWVKREAAGGPVIARRAGTGATGFQLRITADGALALDHGSGTVVTPAGAVRVGVYTHVAASFDAATRQGALYVDGTSRLSGALAPAEDGTAAVRIGSAESGGFFAGEIDEVRFWNRARTQVELREDRGLRLIGDEPGLVAYYRLDEGTGTTAYDQTDSTVHGTLQGTATWVVSGAPVNDHPGVRRDSFTFKDRTVVSGLSACLYHRQENSAAGYDGSVKPAKSQARVLLACATRANGDTDPDVRVATVDFGVGLDGRLAAVPDVLTLAELADPVAQKQEAVAAQGREIARLMDRLLILPAEIDQKTAERTTAEKALQDLTKRMEADPYSWNAHLMTGGSYITIGTQSQPSGYWQVTRVSGTDTAPVVRLAHTASGGNKRTLIESGGLPSLMSGTGFAPTQAQWEVRGSFPTNFRLKSVNTGRWYTVNAVHAVNESEAPWLSLSRDQLTLTDALAAARGSVTALTTMVDGLKRELSEGPARISAAEAALRTLNENVLDTTETLLPLPYGGIDANGLTHTGALLSFARTVSTPHLMDSASGRVTLYFQGIGDEFLAAHLDTAAVRGVQDLSAGTTRFLTFTAQDPAIDLGAAEVTIGDSTHDKLCTLRIVRPGVIDRTFTRLPRKAADLAAFLSDAPQRRIGAVSGVTDSKVRLAQSSLVAVTAGACVRIGASIHVVTAAAPASATEVHVQPPPASTAIGAEVSLVGPTTVGALPSRPEGVPAGLSRWATVTADSADALVPNGSHKLTTRTQGHGSRWRGDAPGRALHLTGTAHRPAVAAASLGQQPTHTAGDVTAEAWVNPQPTGPGLARVLHVNTAGTRAALALEGIAVSGGIALDGTTNAITLPGIPLTDTDFTVECWLKRPKDRRIADTVLSTAGLAVAFDTNGRFTATFGDTTARAWGRYTTDQWTHWAVTYRRATGKLTVVCDGRNVAVSHVTTPPPVVGTPLTIAPAAADKHRFVGELAELRVWGVARTASEIRAAKERRARGDAADPGLIGAWVLEGGAFHDIGGKNRHGTVTGTATAVHSPVAAHHVVAAVCDGYGVTKVLRSKDLHPGRAWAHLAAVYEQSWALAFDGTGWAETPDAERLDIPGDLTIEVFARLDSLGTRQGLISKGRLGDGEDGSVPYQLSVLPDGKLEFAFEEAGDTSTAVIKRFTSTQALTTGFHRIAVVRQGRRKMTETEGPIEVQYTDAGGASKTKSLTGVKAVTVDEWQDIRFFVDGTDHGTLHYEGKGPRGNDGALEIGRARQGTDVHGFHGAVGEVRIWGKAREPKDLGAVFRPRDEGLLARWTFEENEGVTAADPVGGFDLTLRGARWTADPDPRAATFTVHRDGRPIPCDTVAVKPTDSLTDWGPEQLTLGAQQIPPGGAGTLRDVFEGSVEDVRLWRTARTPEQILDHLFTRLNSDKQDLLGYWPFDDGSATADTTLARDHSLRGNDLSLAPSGRTETRLVLSTAPVSTDTAAVRSAIAGVRTDFQQPVSAPPAATEYADLQYTPSGETYGVLKRCYSHLRDGVWHLTTGYKIGDLVSEWVSQVQYDPQLIGYIEGAPPVPAENLVGAPDPENWSKVSFKEADEVTSVLSSSRSRSADVSFRFSAGNEVDAGALLITAPLGIGTAQPAADVKFSGRVGGSLDFSNAWTDEATVQQGTGTDRDTSATLTGSQETTAGNPLIGPRYLPKNQGFALVQSETADIYALRLAHSGALVAYRMTPNPDIPKDWNIISFPINPQYTKQGTLDGCAGFDVNGAKLLDPAYPNAKGRGEYSYFKPREAYALKRGIQRERQLLESYYSSVSTDTGTADPTQERAAKLLERVVGAEPGAPVQKQPTDTAGSYANRNIVNTYVWTADGGFFAETTNTVDVVTETAGGSYSLTGAVTGALSGSFKIAGVGLGFQLDTSVGGGTTVTRSRTRQATRFHRLDVTCNPPRDLRRYGADNTHDATSDQPVAGKVDAYRFMTFYLAQDTAHFDDFFHKVVDPTWLASTAEPSAAALRQARQSAHKPPCWRVMHRVTYVSRILPAVVPRNAPELDRGLRQADLASNYELVRRLDPYVRGATASRARLATATEQALAEQLPKLLPQRAVITDFLADYYGVPADRNQ
ncbi:LamG-like jellyroll fold domain-containing protein [Streptomyces sp. NPDC091377]|uniref:LamG-like jellyroll fold domain-containing protein n=1 Tax=Streptomyces sp. NPDC091377 TaxID=3365995 RepID=UPI0038180C75